MTESPRDDETLDPDFIPPDPDEAPPVELWSAVGDVPPWGTALLLLSWALVFAALAFRREFGDTHALVAWGASATGLGAREVAWRMLASTFVHAGMAHVFFNAASMAIFGPAVERFFTRSGFWLIYAAGGAIASLASLGWRAARHPGALSVSVGGSGAIFALGGALLVCAYRVRHRLAVGRARAMGGALLFLVGQGFAAGFTRHATDNAAHAAGLVAGVALGAVIPLSPRLGGPAPGWTMRVLGTAAVLALVASLALGVRGGLVGG
ncbi:MAG: rhomboid family intramembrane serine protease [Candidatus Eiseniibacteriota bacterium]